MSGIEKVPKRCLPDFIFVTGNLRIVDSLLAAPPGLSDDEVKQIIDQSRKFDVPTILTAMTCQVDVSGLVPNYAGVDRSILNPDLVKAACNPQDVLLDLIRLGEEKLSEIDDYPSQIKDEIFIALGGGKCTLRALSILDQIQGNIISRLRSLRDTSNLALAIRQANQNALYDLYSNPGNRRIMISHLNPKAVGLKYVYADLDRFYSQPRIVYTISKRPEGCVSHISYAFYMPNIFKVHLGKEFHHISIGAVLEDNTPDIYRKYEGEHVQFHPETPWGFMVCIKDFGTPFLRSVASQIKVDENLRTKGLTEQAKLDEIKTYVEAR